MGVIRLCHSCRPDGEPELLATSPCAHQSRSVGSGLNRKSVAFAPELAIRSGHQLNFFLFPFVKNQAPHQGNYFSLPFLPATPSSWTLEVLLEPTMPPTIPINLPRALLPELQRYQDTVRCVALSVEVPGHY